MVACLQKYSDETTKLQKEIITMEMSLNIMKKSMKEDVDKLLIHILYFVIFVQIIYYFIFQRKIKK